MNTVPTAPLPAPRPDTADAGLRQVLLVGAALLLPLLVFGQTTLSLVEIWSRSDTYAHGFLILPISLWLIWRQRAVLAGLPLRPCWPALLPLALCGMLWLLAGMAEVAIGRQYALAAMLPLCVLTLLGWPVTRALVFPLAFLLLAVPVGESLIPPLIDLTADFTVAALRLSGIPVLREGNNFAIPSGNWSVVEACSGLRYLISSITLGALYAYLSYRSAARRAVFMLVACTLPILANGLRAYMIVMIGHLSGMTMAVGVDHLIYGWVFFGLIMALLFWAGSFWREDGGVAAGAGTPRPLPRRPLALALPALLLTLLAWPALAAWQQAQQDHAPPLRLPHWAAPLPPAAPFADWEPDFAPATAVLRQFQQAGQPVGLHLRYYRDDARTGKLISSTNRLGANHGPYRENSLVSRAVPLAGRTLAVQEAQLGQEGQRLLVWQWYWIGEKMTASNYVGKMLQLREKLLTGRGDGVAIMVFSSYEEDPEVARAALRNFLNSNLAPLDAALAGNRAAHSPP